MTRVRFSPLPLAMMLAALGTAAQADTTLAPVEVIDTTPLPGIGIERDRVPANVQRARDLGEASIANGMNTKLNGVTVNENQGNPYQADLNFRGFTASPLLGTPQGLSVYVDGIRVNEGFGDVVNWDLIPQSALEDVSVIPGSNPLFGLNTLGGAISMRTKDGRNNPGTELQASAGSFGRWTTSLTHGGSTDALDWFIAAESLNENGWRDRSPSDVKQLFGKFGWRDDMSDISVSLNYADNDLIGNGLLPDSMYRRNREMVYNYPDQTRNRLKQIAVTGNHWLDDANQLTARIYWRNVHTRTLNGDGNDDFTALPDPSGSINRTATDQYALGVTAQWTHYADTHQLTVGASHDRSRAAFLQTSQEGELNAARGVDPTGDIQPENSLDGRTRSSSVFLTDTYSVTDTVALTGSARYNRTRVINRDRLNATAPNLDGDFTYQRINPALGVTWQIRPALGFYASYNEGNRAPTPIELGCADPANPCTLPNALRSDPRLDQVIAKTLEVGLRGAHGKALNWNASVFRTTNHDDILFVGTSTSAGYFTNFGKTRRQGLELDLSGEHGAFDWRAGYTWLQATFQSSACLLSASNSSAGADPRCGADEIRVASGDRLPGLPRHSLKLSLDWKPVDALRVGTQMQTYSGQLVRGNENGRDSKGRIGGYTVFNLDADWKFAQGWTLFGRVDNLFDRRYETAGALAENIFNAQGRFITNPNNWEDERFVAPGAPRAAWIGVRYKFGGKS
ncbi:TonB-dependent receptor [Nitrogeniibacter mangrovi]|uniref:TonB-dependent receptor n=1 Tax=Nitrogeniibacter mangrovi TaxID=2016596 RepID=A0A6C1B1I4_9RHOO|nr:TonB-dependent receptor [Nitrogeniibacter mangrovi]QID17486.1 TonB-dependent receptor [Nitrogeniibacter mangrovi]